MRILLLGVFLFYIRLVFADYNNLQEQLMLIADKEAEIANIGANKASMLYGTGDAFVIINRWNKIQNKPKLNNEQVKQIKVLEQQKQQILKQATYDK